MCPGAPHGRLPRDSSRRHCVTHDPPVRPRLRRLPLMHPLLNVSMHAIGILCLSKSLLTAAAGAALGSTTATETFSCRSARRAWMALRRVQQMHTHTHTHTHSLSFFHDKGTRFRVPGLLATSKKESTARKFMNRIVADQSRVCTNARALSRQQQQRHQAHIGNSPVYHTHAGAIPNIFR